MLEEEDDLSQNGAVYPRGEIGKALIKVRINNATSPTEKKINGTSNIPSGGPKEER